MKLLRFFLLYLFHAILAAVVVNGVAQAATANPPQTPLLRRLAVVIGNSSYRSDRMEKLANAANDADRISQSLKRLNFEVLMVKDAASEDLERLLAEAEARLPAVGAVLVFYAGHGVQINGENYLLPVDTPDPDTVEKLTEKAVRLNDVIARFSARDRQTFVFLDACRNNPLVQGVGSNGLAQVDVGENTFVAFATQPGNVTVDGADANSPFTTALLDNMEIPGLSISDMMIRVRNRTEALTVGRQVPWDQSNLREQFYFTEQQVIDPTHLSASLSRILSDPEAKRKLQAELASNDLQTAVLIVGQALRSVDGPAGPMQNGLIVGGEPQTQVANLNPSILEGMRRNVATDIGLLIVGTQQQTGHRGSGELARNVQTELKRLGCYRMNVDGHWGKGSRRALQDFYRNTKQDNVAGEPTVELLSDLFLRSGRICKEPVMISKVRSTNVSSDGRGNTSRTSKAEKRPGSTSRAPVPPPPDISGGIGIGGIF